MKKVLLLGANGQLATDIVYVFSSSTQYEIIKIYREKLNFENYSLIFEFLKRIPEFDYVVNCVSYHKTDECEDFSQKSFIINSLAVSEIAKYCSLYNKTLVHISTDYVFDGMKQEPYSEDDPTSPLNVYGNTKVAGENFINAYHDKYFIFRVSSLFGKAGASGKGGNFVETMLKLAKEGKTLRVVNDQIMSPTHTLDIAKAIKHFMDNNIDNYGVYHCSGEGQCSWYDFASEIFRMSNAAAKLQAVSSADYSTKAKRPLYSVLDNTKISYYFEMPYWKDSLEQYLKIKCYI